MKKIISKVLIIPLLFLLVFTNFSCTPPANPLNRAMDQMQVYCTFGQYTPWNSVWGSNQLIEQDEYGRFLFSSTIYQEDIIFKLTEVNNTSESTSLTPIFMYYFVGQTFDKEKSLVYYYPTNQMIVKYNEEPSEDEINKLKELNDWNKEIDLSKCIRRRWDIIYNNQYVDTNHIVEYMENNIKDASNYFIKSCLLDVDQNGLEFYAVSFGSLVNGMTQRAFAVISSPIYPYETVVYEIKNYDYIEELEKFKEDNNWQYNYIRN